MTHAEEIVNDLEAVASCGVIDCCDICHHGVFGGSVVFEEGDDGKDAIGGDIDCELVFPDRKLLYVFWHAGKEVLAVRVKAGGFFLVFIGGVYDWGVELAAS